MKSFKEYVAGALTEAQKYTVKVEVRDARKANDLAQDSYRGLYKNDGSDVFIFKKKSDKEDFENDLLNMKLGIIEESVKKGSDLKVGDKVKEVEPMGQFKPGDILEIVRIKSGRIGVIAKGQNPKDALFDNPNNFKLVNET